MSKLTRITNKQFGSAAGGGQIGQYGSLVAASPTTTTDPAVMMSLSNWLTGWFGAVVGANSPAIEDLNAMSFVYSYQLGYLLQQGAGTEWDSGTTYYINSIVMGSDGNLYQSKTDNNLNNAISSGTNWKVFSAPLSYSGSGNAVLTSVGATSSSNPPAFLLPGIDISPASGTAVMTNSSPTQVTNMTATLTVSKDNADVMVSFSPPSGGNFSCNIYGQSVFSTNPPSAIFGIQRTLNTGSPVVTTYQISLGAGNTGSGFNIQYSAGILNMLDTGVAAGNYTYVLLCSALGSTTWTVTDTIMKVRELP